MQNRENKREHKITIYTQGERPIINTDRLTGCVWQYAKLYKQETK